MGLACCYQLFTKCHLIQIFLSPLFVININCVSFKEKFENYKHRFNFESISFSFFFFFFLSSVTCKILAIFLQCRETVKASYNIQIVRSSHRRCCIRKGVLKNFAKFKEKHLCQGVFQVAGLGLIKKDKMAQVFSCEFCEMFKGTFSYRAPVVAASDDLNIVICFNF